MKGFSGGSQHTIPRFKPVPLLWLFHALLFLSTSAASPLCEPQRGEGRAWPCCCTVMAAGALCLNHAALPSSRHKARGASRSSEGRDPPHQRGEAEWREPHRLRAAGEANRELQRILVCTPGASLLLVSVCVMLRASNSRVVEAEWHQFQSQCSKKP